MKIGDAYNTNLIITRIDPMSIVSIREACKKNEKLNNTVTKQGLFLYIEENDEMGNEVLYRLTIGCGQTEPNQFDVGYFLCDEKDAVNKAIDYMINNKKAEKACNKLIEYIKKTYLNNSNDDMYSSIIRKLWRQARTNCSNWDKLVEDARLTDAEFEAIISI